MNTDSCLLIDNSNTRTKLMLCCPDREAELRIVPTCDISRESLMSALDGWVYDRVCLCSVVPWAARVISETLSAVPLLRLAARAAREVDFSRYPGVDTLGEDRVANALAAVRYAPLPLVAVDLGTASTFDVVVDSEHGPVFAGGVIAPGLAAVAGCLHANTAQLPAVTWDAPGPVIGRNTHEALAAALRVGYPAMIDAVLSGIESELGRPVHVLLTGGDAAALAPHLHHESVLVPSLTLEGIALFANVSI